MTPPKSPVELKDDVEFKYMFLNDSSTIYFDALSNKMKGCTENELIRYLKGVFPSYERFKNRFYDYKVRVTKYGYPDDFDFEIPGLIYYPQLASYLEKIMAFLKRIHDLYEDATPFSYQEAFELENRDFQALVFSSIDVPEMINQLGAKRIATDGIEVNHRQYDADGNFLGLKPYHNVYETYEVSGKKLNIEAPLYAIKCWCTSTNKEHWLWINDQHKNDPLQAIASTFIVHENVIPHIKALKRQGDILLTELDQEVTPKGDMVSLTKEQYFGLLVAQS
jgi:hypothetical protein